MATGVVKDLFSRRVPQILGIYLAISWGIVEFVGLLVDRYLLSPHLLTFGMVGLASLIPTVLLLAVHIALQIQRMKNEEAVLKAAFPEYEPYMRRTHRVLPGLY